jgi:hypothetical protein
MLHLRKANRKKSKIRLALQGPSGAGKTYSALLVAFGLCNDWSRIAVVDTESNSADLYSHLGSFNVLNLSEPFTPEKYIEAIKLCENSGCEVIIIDSISHEWEGLGGILDSHSKIAGNSFVNWAKVTPRHNAFIQAMLQSSCHVLATIRTKHDYVISQKDGKAVPEKIGLKAIQRDNVEFEFTVVFDLDMKNNASATKDRSRLFFGKPEQKLSAETGKQILVWCNEGTDSDQEINDILAKVQAASTVDELIALYKANPIYQQKLLSEFTKRRNDLQTSFTDLKSIENGTIK